MSDILDFLDAPGADESTTAATIVPAEPPAPEAAPAPEPVAPPEGESQPRGPDGKFAPKAEPAPAAAAPTEKPAEPALELSGVYKAMMDERDRRQALEREVDALKKAQPQPQPQAPPDRIEDPEGYEAYQQEKLDQRIQRVADERLNDKLHFSERLARKEYGAEFVVEAKKWGLERGANEPGFAQRVLSDPDPYEYVVAEYKRHQTAQMLNDPATLDAFRAWQAAQTAGSAVLTPAAPAPVPAAPAQPAPPRSIVHAPAAGGGKPGEVQAGPGVAFNSIFPT